MPVWAASSREHLLLQNPHFLLLWFSLISNKSLYCWHFTPIYNTNIQHKRITCMCVTSKTHILNILLLLPFSAVLYLCLISATIIAIFPRYPVVRCYHGYVQWWLGLSTNQKLFFWILTSQRACFCYTNQLDSIKQWVMVLSSWNCACFSVRDSKTNQTWTQAADASILKLLHLICM